MSRRGAADLTWPVGMALGAGIAAGAGWFAAPWLSAHLGPPVAIDPAAWMILVPGRDQSMADAAESSGTGIVDGALLLGIRAFGRPDVLIPRAGTVVRAIDISLAPDSGPLVVNIHDASGAVAHAAELTPTGWRARPSAPITPYASGSSEAVRLELSGTLVVDGVPNGAGAPTKVEFVSRERAARITALRLTGADGSIVAEGTFGLPEPSRTVRGGGAMLGALVLAALAIVVRGPGSAAKGILSASLTLVPPALVLATPYTTWRAIGERLYLLHTPAADLRTGVFLAALLPLGSASILATGVLPLERGSGPQISRIGIVAALILTTALGCQHLRGPELLWALPGLAFLALPWRSAGALGYASRDVLLREIPTYLFVAGLGWGTGLLPAVLWRLLCLWADARVLLASAPRLGADALFLTVACLPFGVEGALRSTYLLDGWDPEKLVGTNVGETGRSAVMVPFWEGTCGEQARVIYTFGGSSAGGAYQFRHDAGAFFPARLHARMCERGLSVHSRNFGNGGRDSQGEGQRREGEQALSGMGPGNSKQERHGQQRLRPGQDRPCHRSARGQTPPLPTKPPGHRQHRATEPHLHAGDRGERPCGGPGQEPCRRRARERPGRAVRDLRREHRRRQGAGERESLEADRDRQAQARQSHGDRSHHDLRRARKPRLQLARVVGREPGLQQRSTVHEVDPRIIQRKAAPGGV